MVFLFTPLFQDAAHDDGALDAVGVAVAIEHSGFLGGAFKRNLGTLLAHLGVPPGPDVHTIRNSSKIDQQFLCVFPARFAVARADICACDGVVRQKRNAVKSVHLGAFDGVRGTLVICNHSSSSKFGGVASRNTLCIFNNRKRERQPHESEIDNRARAKPWRMVGRLELANLRAGADELVHVRQICPPKPTDKRSGACDSGAGCTAVADDAGADASDAGSLNSVLRNQAGMSSAWCCTGIRCARIAATSAAIWRRSADVSHMGSLRVLVAKDSPVHIRAQVFAAHLTCCEIFNSQAMFCWNTPVARRPKVHRLVRNTDVLGQLLNATGQLDGGMYVFHSSILHM